MLETKITQQRMKGDPNATFYHIIHFCADKPAMKGYSKGVKYTEKSDMIMQIQNVIVRLKTSGYTAKGGTNSLNKPIPSVHCIEFYLNKDDAKFLTLYDDDFELDFNALPHPRFWQWLRYFVKDMEASTSPSDLRRKHINMNFDRVFQIDRLRFLDTTSLKKHCKRLIQDKHDPEIVKEFEKVYTERWFSKKDSYTVDEVAKMNLKENRDNIMKK